MTPLKRRFVLRNVVRAALFACVVFLCCCIIAAALQRTGIRDTRFSLAFYLFSIGCSAAASLVYAGIKRRRFSHFLIDLDRRLGLKDAVSTAYEYHCSGKASTFKSQLLADASKKLDRFGSRQLMPAKYTLTHLLFVVLIAVNGLLFLTDRFSFVSTRADASLEANLNPSRSPVNKPAPKRKRMKTEEKSLQDKKYRKLETLAKKLNDPAITRKGLLSTLNEMLEEVQSSQSLLSKQTRSTGRYGGTEHLPNRKIKRYEDESLNRLKSLFRAMFSDRVPERIETDAALKAEYRRLEKLLAHIAGNTDERTSDQQNADETAPQADPKRSRYTNREDKNRTNRNDKGRDAPPDENHRPDESLADSEYPGREMRNQGDLEDFGLEGHDTSLSPGHAKSGDRSNDPYELKKKQGPALQDKLMSTEQEDYSVHIRSLTSVGRAKIKPETIDRRYNQELEGILKKEDIPLNYRNYIKNYFISIGFRKEGK